MTRYEQNEDACLCKTCRYKCVYKCAKSSRNFKTRNENNKKVIFRCSNSPREGCIGVWKCDLYD